MLPLIFIPPALIGAAGALTCLLARAAPVAIRGAATLAKGARTALTTPGVAAAQAAFTVTGPGAQRLVARSLGYLDGFWKLRPDLGTRLGELMKAGSFKWEIFENAAVLRYFVQVNGQTRVIGIQIAKAGDAGATKTKMVVNLEQVEAFIVRAEGLLKGASTNAQIQNYIRVQSTRPRRPL